MNPVRQACLAVGDGHDAAERSPESAREVDQSFRLAGNPSHHSRVGMNHVCQPACQPKMGRAQQERQGGAPAEFTRIVSRQGKLAGAPQLRQLLSAGL